MLHERSPAHFGRTKPLMAPQTQPVGSHTCLSHGEGGDEGRWAPLMKENDLNGCVSDRCL